MNDASLANLTGGSRKGIKNKRSFKCEMTAHELGIDPFKVLLLVVAGDYAALGLKADVETDDKGEASLINPISLDQRIDAAKAAMPYLAPKQKSVEIKTADDGPIAITLNYKV